uniref:Si:dkey-97a13.6 n=1 Tax=Cyprinus carpio carpio TaxID=630221 RepID=A0A9J8D0W5_CYPCA
MSDCMCVMAFQEMSTVQSRDAQLQAFMQEYELRAACNACTHKYSRISYSIIATPHRCSHNLLLVRAKVRGHRWNPVSMRPSYPHPNRYEVCWYFKEDVGCYVHHDRCTFASSPEEAAVLIHLITQRQRLDEQSRQEDGQSRAHEPLSYKEKLLEEYRRSCNEILIVSIMHKKTAQCNNAQPQNFDRSLAHVALLKAENGAVFSLSDSLKKTFPPVSYIAGHHLRSSDSSYQLSVSFLSFRPGVYEQWLVFDFDIRPVLLRKLKVRVGQQFHVQPDEAEESECVEIFLDERWNRGNRVIVPFFARREEDEQLLSKYKPPQINLKFNPHADQSSPLHRDNYRERAHHFLFREEIAEEELLSRLNVCGSVSLSNQLSDGISQFSAAAGKLFATLKVSCLLTPDSPEGLMFKRGVQMALVNCMPAKASVSVDNRNHVYEALVLKKAAGEGHISLHLSAQCVSELQLRKETRCKMEVQFQLDRLSFCQIHQAIDHLPDLHNVLPDFSNSCVPVYITKQTELNNKQQIALNFILGKCEVNKVASPLLIYGPFGTGKTLCLASAAKQLALRSKNKVLICTYTNSSADLYVRDHFHPYITNGHPNLKILRIKANKGGASIKATDDITQKYCLCSLDRQSFIRPARSDLESHHIIITTTSMARHFRELKLPEGFFSHILIDEASQMLEGEALMALGLAGKHTRVVLAGDHMQMAPKLFSVTDDKRSEHTLLYRLFRYYQDESSNIAKKSRVIFNENYRSTSEIVDFVSTYFYVSDGIKAKGEIPPHPRLHPLIFHHVRGECHLNSTSMSWFNLAEVNNVINIMRGLLTDWPVEWGHKEPKQICVLSEGQQLDVIKNHLRQKGVHGVSVQNLANIQGKQFRVIIITTVQTRDRLLQSESSRPEFFDDIRALNTALTRAQSLVIVVGDAGALCCFGKCSKIWRSYIEHCISKGSINPDNFTKDILQQEVLEISKFQKTEKIEMSDMSDIPLQAETDAILKEMDDYDSDVQDSDDSNELKRPLFSSSEKENLLELVRKQPAIYKHGELVMKEPQSGYVVPYDNPSEHINIKGRKNIGMSFPGDEVVVETGRDDEGSLTGKVLGFTNRQPTSSEFVCFLENESYHKRMQNTDKNLLPKMMIPLNHNTTKICVLVRKDARNFIPVWKYANGDWTVTRRFRLDEQTKPNYVFVVQILGWKAHFSFPLGRVTDIRPIGTSLEEGLDILKSEFRLMSPPLMQKDAFTEMKTDDKERRDFRHLQTFTVDPPTARDLDDAISVNNLGSCYEIGVHVADVASFVSKDSSLDRYAKEMGATFYDPGKEPTFMFPKHLATSFWSLLPGKDRKAISLIVEVEKQSGIITKRTFDLSNVKSKKKLTYKQTEDIISQCDGELRFDTLEDCVRVAYHFARSQRKARLKEDWNYAQLDKHRKPGEREGNLMVEELNIMFNHEVSKFLTEHTDTTFCTPLRCQAPPMADQLEMISNQHMEIIPLSSHLTFHIDRNRVDLKNSIKSAASTSDFYRMADLISTDEIHPHLVPVTVQLKATFKKAFFIRSLSCKNAFLGHYSLHLDSYTHASSPIRRYIDVVLQRLMHSVLCKHPVEYSQTDIDLLCDKCKRGEVRAREYENKAESLLLAISLQKQSTYKVAFVTVVKPDSENFKLSFPFDKGTFPDRLPVKYRNLQLKDQPIFNNKQKQVTLTWKKRIYSLSMTQTPLQNLRSCSEIQLSTWHAIVEAVRDEEWEEAKSLVLATDVRDHSEINEVHDTSRLDPDRTFMSEEDHYTDFTLYLKAGDTVQVQLTSERERGYWATTVQLFSVRSSFEICVEHTDNPIRCFSKLANHPSKSHYKDVEEYVQIWKPLCEMESAATAVDDSDCVVIENVLITWILSFDDSRLSGTFSLPVEYVKKWAIEFDLAKCLICIRKRVLKQNHADQSELDPEYFTWVAHGLTTQCLDPPDISENKSKIIHFSIKYPSMKILKFKRNDTFTVEVIPKLIPDIRKESAVNNLPAANELVKSIALRHRILKKSIEEPPAGLPLLNESQFKALEQALNGKFTVIQGPPGTGKTVVGAYIVYWFSQLNSKNPWKLKELKDKKREVILYCGPSNKSVDVVAEYLLKFGNKLKQLRVYSRQMEMQEYPYPGSNLQLSHKSLLLNFQILLSRDITLHHRIRMSHNPHSQAITDFDKRIAHKPHSLTDLLNSARLYELESHDVILCTCTAAASPNLTKTLSARQILIDECAMATEPQTLVPLVSFKPEKVVLLGDHKQLRPIVKNEHVRRLGMTRSLFERYMDRALLLDTQYRMHEEICRFPSEAYYLGRLRTKVDERTSVLHIQTERSRQSKHILFGDIRGDEISLVVSTARGNENSKANFAEVKKAVEICAQLVSVGHVRQEDIAILSPYNAQVAQIRDRLKSTDPQMDRITVTTITKSQGSEWQYVILSMVRSCPSNEIEPYPPREWLSKHIGFVGDENQINVGITRAQDGLCILGNQEVLNCSTAWKKLLKHYSGQGCVVSVDQITVHNVR